jgi:hypothetical protein
METLTRTVLRIIGSPLIDRQADQEIVESEELYRYAFSNNVEMLYLERLEETANLDSLGETCADVRARQAQTLKTVCRLSSVLKAGGIPHAVTKTLRPYPGTPNDVDTLYLGGLGDYEAAARHLVANNYRITAPQDMQFELFDLEYGEEFNKFKHGGRFYIDFYRELAADHMPYMDSSILAGQVTEVEVPGCAQTISVLTRKAELVVLALHAIIMHRTIPLEVFYTYSYWLQDMSDQDLDELWDFARLNHAEPGVRAVVTVIAELYRECFGAVPDRLAYLLALTGTSRREARALQATGLYVPHTATLMSFLVAVLAKTRGRRARRGFLKELLHMLNPVFAVEVLYHMLSRKRIRRHSAHV